MVYDVRTIHILLTFGVNAPLESLRLSVISVIHTRLQVHNRIQKIVQARLTGRCTVAQTCQHACVGHEE